MFNSLLVLAILEMLSMCNTKHEPKILWLEIQRVTSSSSVLKTLCCLLNDIYKPVLSHPFSSMLHVELHGSLCQDCRLSYTLDGSC